MLNSASTFTDAENTGVGSKGLRGGEGDEISTCALLTLTLSCRSLFIALFQLA